MSVALYNDAELCGLWHKLGGDSGLQWSLAKLAAANRAAYMISYGEVDFDWPALVKPVERTDGWQPAPVEHVENLIYNCVSQGGTDFAPQEAKLALREAATAIARMKGAR